MNKVFGLIANLGEVEREAVETLCLQFPGEVVFADDDLEDVADCLGPCDMLVAHSFRDIEIDADAGEFLQGLMDSGVGLAVVEPIDLTEIALLGQQMLIRREIDEVHAGLQTNAVSPQIPWPHGGTADTQA